MKIYNQKKKSKMGVDLGKTKKM